MFGRELVYIPASLEEGGEREQGDSGFKVKRTVEEEKRQRLQHVGDQTSAERVYAGELLLKCIYKVSKVEEVLSLVIKGGLQD